jgi:hypothetical protein
MSELQLIESNNATTATAETTETAEVVRRNTFKAPELDTEESFCCSLVVMPHIIRYLQHKLADLNATLYVGPGNASATVSQYRRRVFSVSRASNNSFGEYIAIAVDDYMTYDMPPCFTIPLDNVCASTAYEISVAVIDDLIDALEGR